MQQSDDKHDRAAQIREREREGKEGFWLVARQLNQDKASRKTSSRGANVWP